MIYGNNKALKIYLWGFGLAMDCDVFFARKINGPGKLQKKTTQKPNPTKILYIREFYTFYIKPENKTEIYTNKIPS
jgi:hypothetical protein